MNKDNNFEKNICSILELEYMSNRGELPSEWYQSDNYELKNQIIAIAINNNIDVINIELYKKLYSEVNQKKL